MYRLLLPSLLLCCAVVRAHDYPATASDYLKLFDRDGDGRVSEQEYVGYLSAGFRAMDANGDGVLDAGELPPGPRRTPRTLAAFQADLRAQFHRLDRNHDGFLSARELAQPPR
jgi:Ca2+-binding EF-hand superfamily protein